MDLFRPAQMQTSQYGQAWKQYTHESRFQVRPTSVATPAEFMARVQRDLHLHPVQTINTENIVAGRLVQAMPPGAPFGHPSMLLLLHCKVSPGMLACMVRSAEPQFSKAAAAALPSL